MRIVGFVFLVFTAILALPRPAMARDTPILDWFLGQRHFTHEHRVIYYPVVPVLVTSSPTVIYSQPAIPMVPHYPTILAPLPIVPRFGER